MAIIDGTPNGETLTRKLAVSIIADLGGNDQRVGDDGSGLLQDVAGHGNIDGGFGNDALIGGAVDHDHNKGEVAGRRATGAVPLFNIFRPF